MSDKSIIFSAPMVLALLAGRKTQTRRLSTSPLRRAQVGDRLWVRETWAPTLNSQGELHPPAAVYAAGWERAAYKALKPWKPSIHMPRWASRLTLTVTKVRVQRLQEISSADAIAEGISPSANSQTIDCDTPDPRTGYSALWDSLHPKAPHRWDDNPEVVALTFSVAKEHIDARSIPA